jgi:hypothetical protein
MMTSNIKKRKAQAVSSKESKARNPPAEDSIDIPEDEQWRLVNQSGILNQIPTAKQEDKPAEEPVELAEEIFNAAVIVVPFTFLLVLMEVYALLFMCLCLFFILNYDCRLVHFQYRQQPTFAAIKDRLVSGFPSEYKFRLFLLSPD